MSGLASPTSPILAPVVEAPGRCRLCERRCEADRTAAARGFCKASSQARVFRHRVEWGEELELVPSHLFYLSGCNLRCVFCIAEDNSVDAARGRLLTPKFFAEAVRWGQSQGARYVEWVGGEPTIHLPAILEVMASCEDLPPIVWKSNFYFVPDVFDWLAGAVDIYVADFKFGNDQCASSLAGATRYTSIVTRNLLLASDRANLIVRHLLLPGHWDCCFLPIVSWLRENLPKTKFSIWDGYLPCWRARNYEPLATPLPPDAGGRARCIAREHGLNVIQ
ncbi:MAG: radical SAM protein [Planctomycetes bacterium]|nr:radical SAM protein [Planctomycetota bacterium]